MIPVGFMLAPAIYGETMTVVICTGHGPQAMQIDREGRPVEQRQSTKETCPYAGSTPIAVALADLLQLSVPAEYADAGYPLARVSTATLRWIGASWARGPPFII